MMDLKGGVLIASIALVSWAIFGLGIWKLAELIIKLFH